MKGSKPTKTGVLLQMRICGAKTRAKHPYWRKGFPQTSQSVNKSMVVHFDGLRAIFEHNTEPETCSEILPGTRRENGRSRPICERTEHVADFNVAAGNKNHLRA
jgi:hypothetical protein